MFNAQTYAQRRKRLYQQLDSGILVFLGNEESSMNYRDNTYHFRQDSTFLYFFGLDYPSLAAVVDLDEQREIIFGDDLTVEDIIWMGTQPTLKERAAKAGIDELETSRGLYSYLEKARKANRTIHYLPPYRPENVAKLEDLLLIPKHEVSDGASVPFIKAVVEQRSVKSAEEVDELMLAADITADMHLAAMEFARPGMTEAQVAAEVQRVAVAAGGQISFPTIMTVHGETLHNHFHGNVIQPGDLVLNDSGAETARHYAGDMSRTFPADKRFTSRQRDIYAIALEAHDNAIEELKPGILFRDVHLLACRTIAAGLKELGLMKGDLDEAVNQGAHALFFPCGTGHMMGLDVHDMEDLGEQYVGYNDSIKKSTLFGLKSLRLGKTLKPGYVLTVEPGIYFIPELIDSWENEGRFLDFLDYEKINAYRDFGGLRSEEDFLITEDGYRLLGKPVPKAIADVEAVRG